MCIYVYAYIHGVCVCCVYGESGGVERVEGWREGRGGESGGVERMEGWRECVCGESGGSEDMHVLRVYVLCVCALCVWREWRGWRAVCMFVCVCVCGCVVCVCDACGEGAACHI